MTPALVRFGRLVGPRRPILMAATLACIALMLAGCGPSSNTAGSPPSSNPSAQSDRPAGTGGFGRGQQPGVYGLVAAVEGSTAQVQSQDSQTAVSWTTKTTFTAVSTGSAASVGVGDCVFVRDAGTGQATPAAGSTEPTSVTASSVQVRPAAKSGCTGEPFGRAGTRSSRPSGRFSVPPNGSRPSGMPSRAPASFGGVDGTVTKVGSTGFEVRAVAFGRRDTATASPTASASPQSSTVQVHTTSSTTYSVQKSSTARAVTVGRCLQAEGSTDSTGAVTATSVTVTPSENGACDSAFGGRGDTSGHSPRSRNTTGGGS